jgi:hypothetical protein
MACGFVNATTTKPWRTRRRVVRSVQSGRWCTSRRLRDARGVFSGLSGDRASLDTTFRGEDEDGMDLEALSENEKEFEAALDKADARAVPRPQTRRRSVTRAPST